MANQMVTTFLPCLERGLKYNQLWIPNPLAARLLQRSHESDLNAGLISARALRRYLRDS